MVNAILPENDPVQSSSQGYSARHYIVIIYRAETSQSQFHHKPIGISSQ